METIPFRPKLYGTFYDPYIDIRFLKNGFINKKYIYNVNVNVFDSYSTLNYYKRLVLSTINDNQIYSSKTCKQLKKTYKQRKKWEITRIPESYGIILYYINPIDNEKYILIGKRRSSYEYSEFINGNYGYLTDNGELINNSKKKLRYLFSNFSKEEKLRIKNNDNFDLLFNDEWLGKYCNVLKKHYIYSKQKYYKKFEYIKELANSTTYGPNYKLWGFPSGRKNKLDNTDFDSAIREFSEETNIPIENLELFRKNPMRIIHRGSDNKSYAYKFYIMTIKHKIISKISDPLLIFNRNKQSIENYCIDNDYLKCITNNNSLIRKETISDELCELKWIKYSRAALYLDKAFLHALNNSYLFINDKFP
jgi:hypothetical protein